MVIRTFCRAILLAPVVLLAAGPNGLAQAPPATIPDVSGVWGVPRCVEGNRCMLIEPDSPLLTERARAFQRAFDEIAAPKYDCAPMSIPHLYTDPYGFQIQQQKDRVVITYEKDDIVRTVWLEGHGHTRPPLGQFFVHGYATGRYEGDALVVQTTRFTFDPTGLNSDFKMPTSSQKRVTERFRRDGKSLLLEVTTEDTFFLRTPWVYRVRSQPLEGELSLPWDCDLAAARQSLKLTITDYPNDPPVVRLPEPK